MTKIPGLKLIKSITWDEVFASWAQSEATLPHWIEHYKMRGFSSWEDWRKSSTKSLHPADLKWNLFEIENPTKTVPDFYGGPFRSWINKYYGDNRILQFRELAKIPDIMNNPDIDKYIKVFPRETTLVGILNSNKIVIIEGLHRGCTLAVASAVAKPINARVLIALAEFTGEIPLLGQPDSPT